jgi:chromosome segregation protein
LQQLDVQIAKQQSAAQAFYCKNSNWQINLKQLDLQLEEDAMQKDDLEIDLHALAMKLETILPTIKLCSFR